MKNKCWLEDRCKKYRSGTCHPDEFCIKRFKLEALYNAALLSEYQRVRVDLFPEADGTDKDIFDTLKNIETNIEEFVHEGRNLYLHSTTCGNGKTAWAVRMIQSYLNKIWISTDLKCKALFINVPRFLLTLKDSISNSSDYIDHIKKYVLDADIVVWDEIGVKALTTYEHENLLNLINTRLDCGKSNIYTSNLEGEELREKIGDRLYSRVVNLSTTLEFKGGDKRGFRHDSVTVSK